MTVIDYFRLHFPNHHFNDEDAGGGDGCTDEDILGELETDTSCGLQCKMAIDAAVALCNNIEMAYGKEGSGHPIAPPLYYHVVDAAIQVSVCFIRG